MVAPSRTKAFLASRGKDSDAATHGRVGTDPRTAPHPEDAATDGSSKGSEAPGEGHTHKPGCTGEAFFRNS